jgi:phosphoglycerate dehydrogenase-like enzyme
MLPICDHVVLTLPLTDETRGMIGGEEFRLMKDSAFFVNVGRGELVDEEELFNALVSGTISGAGLDVFNEEPLPDHHPFWKMKNVILTPHSSVGGDPEDELVVSLFIRNLESYLKGERLINIIDKSKGY